ncbi:hypothetical protein M440DRAFT_1389726 [Trichoderma longibrachiatum ATCC 18648]|uniref:Uncharacterized protein n=1 Tax=Trichoderma longibrachiatum ATCC 18648 TaxID=983965 RepID=A0A2T4CE46_TRILO|nr:hypothetical protein M440DRAFT_1389726 [Trichoderma longibrachiatum ATCC 18648]
MLEETQTAVILDPEPAVATHQAGRIRSLRRLSDNQDTAGEEIFPDSNPGTVCGQSLLMHGDGAKSRAFSFSNNSPRADVSSSDLQARAAAELHEENNSRDAIIKRKKKSKKTGQETLMLHTYVALCSQPPDQYHNYHVKGDAPGWRWFVFAENYSATLQSFI